MTPAEIAAVVLYFIGFTVVMVVSVRTVRAARRNPLDREQDIQKLPTAREKRLVRPAAHQKKRKR